MVSALTNLSNLLTKAREQLKPVVSNVERILNPITNFTRSNPVATGVILGVPAGAITATAVSRVRSSRKKKSKSKKSPVKRKRSKTRKPRHKTYKKKRQRKPYTAGKGKDRSSRRIRFTKNNQPYIILRSGKARFIKKSSVRRSRKRKGGKY